jgi:hypothetical protein
MVGVRPSDTSKKTKDEILGKPLLTGDRCQGRKCALHCQHKADWWQ